MTLPQHLDPTIPLLLSDIPKETIARLRKNGRAHAARARKLNKAREAINATLPERQRQPLIEIEDFDPIEVYQEHDWTCPHCFRRVDITKSGRHPDSCVLGHNVNFAAGGGHTRENVGPWHYSCNAEVAAGIEVPREAKINRLRKKEMGIDRYGKKARPKPKTLYGKGFQKTKSKWPKGRKLQSRNDLRKK